MKNPFIKKERLRPGRAGSACYRIAKEISYLYEGETSRHLRGSRGRRVKVV